MRITGQEAETHRSPIGDPRAPALSRLSAGAGNIVVYRKCLVKKPAAVVPCWAARGREKRSREEAVRVFRLAFIHSGPRREQQPAGRQDRTASRARVVQRNPGAVSGAGTHCRLDEAYAVESVARVGVPDVAGGRLASLCRTDCARDLRIDRCKSFEITLRMARWDASHSGRRLACCARAARDDLARLVERRMDQPIGVALAPCQSALVAVHAY